MGRKAGSMIRCVCTNCGAVEERSGCTSGFRCTTCGPGEHANPYYQAHNAVTKAVRSGDLRPANEFACKDCGKRATEYDHRDYSKPLDVEPVCHSCNLRRGPAIGRRAPPPPH